MLPPRKNSVYCLVLVLGLLLVAPESHAQPQCGDPDPSVVVLTDASVYDVDGSDMITVIPNPFPDDSLIGYYIATHTGPRYTDEYFKIISNEHFDQWNISVFTADQDLETIAGTNWWYYEEFSRFDIVGFIPCQSCEFDEDCDDGDSCTTDTCNVDDEVCVFTAIDCDDADACTTDSCAGGACDNDPISCDDGDSCTIDSCDSVTGCANDPIDCDDGDACTADSCSGGSCSNDPICGLDDGCCDPSCDPGGDPDCFVCGERNDPCSSNSDCCSNKCKGNGRCR